MKVAERVNCVRRRGRGKHGRRGLIMDEDTKKIVELLTLISKQLVEIKEAIKELELTVRAYAPI